MTEAALDRGEDLDGLGHHFRSDAIAGKSTIFGISRILSHAATSVIWDAANIPVARDCNVASIRR